MEGETQKTLAKGRIGTNEQAPGQGKMAKWMKKAIESLRKKSNLAEGLMVLSIATVGSAAAVAATASCGGAEFTAGKNPTQDAESEKDAEVPETGKDSQTESDAPNVDVPETAVEADVPDVLPDNIAPDVVESGDEKDAQEEESGPVVKWKYNMKVDINSGIGADLNNFPAYFVVDTASLITNSKMNADCSDLVVTNQAQDEQYSHEIEKNTCNTDKTVVFIKIPLLMGGMDNPVWLLYGNTLATDTQKPAEVWGENYTGVFHMAESINLAPSVGSISLTKKGSTSRVDGKLGYGYSTSPTDYFEVSPGSMSTPVTISFAFKSASVTALEPMLYYNDGCGNGFAINGGASGVRIDWGCNPGQGVSGNIYTGNWSTFTMTYVPGGEANIYIDGNLRAQRSGGGNGGVNVKGVLGQISSGTIDEIRYSKVIRSADWVKAESVQTYALGSEQNNP